MQTSGEADPYLVTTLDTLQRHYSEVESRSICKEVDRLTPSYRRFAEAATFVIIASAGFDGLDCSPRGDAECAVRVIDERTLLIPDRRGNNRIDTLRNIVADPRVGLLLLVPGQGETLRINGRAEISVDPRLLDNFTVGPARPRSVLRVKIDRVYFQCARAILRAGLWSGSRPRQDLPTAGEMLRDCDAGFDAESYDKALPERQKGSLY